LRKNLLQLRKLKRTFIRNEYIVAEGEQMEKAKIRARLVERGTSYRQWAMAHNYQPRTVTQAVNRWAGKADLPRGRLTYSILRDLSLYIGDEVTKGVLA